MARLTVRSIVFQFIEVSPKILYLRFNGFDLRLQQDAAPMCFVRLFEFSGALEFALKTDVFMFKFL